MEVVDTCIGVCYNLFKHFINDINSKTSRGLQTLRETPQSPGLCFRMFVPGLVFAPKESSLFTIFHLTVIVFFACKCFVFVGEDQHTLIHQEHQSDCRIFVYELKLE